MALGSRPAPNVIQPARPHQAASSRATLAGGAARAAKLGIFTVAPPAVARTSATRHVVARLSVETHVHRAAARRLPSRRAASQRRGSGDNTPGRRCMGDCAGGAVLKKIAARFSLRGLRARIDTIAHATESHGVRRSTIAVARRAGAQRACRVVRLHTHAESGRAFVRRPGSTQLAPLLADMRRVECLTVCLARGGPVWAPCAGTRAGAKRSRCDV